MKEEKTHREVYEKLGKLSKAFDVFRKENTAALSVEDVELMKDVYDDVQVISKGQLANRLNVGCDLCIRDAFQVFLSVYDRMHRDPAYNKDLAVDAKGSDDVDYTDQLTGKANPNGLKGEANLLTVPTAAEIEEARLAALAERGKKVLELGFTFNEPSLTYSYKTFSIGKEELDSRTDDDFNELLTQLENNKKALDVEPEPEPKEEKEGVTVQPPVFAPEKEPKKEVLEGTPLNTKETLTPAQKAAATKKAKADAKLKGEANK